VKTKNEKMKLNIQLFAQSDAEIKFKVILDDNTDEFNKKGVTTQGVLSKIGSVGKVAFTAVTTGISTATTALGGLVAKSVSMAGDLEQQMGGTEAVFKDYAKTVQEQGSKAFETMGLSANDYMATMNKMGALMQGSGIDIETSMNLSSDAMQRAADVASIMGIDIDMAMESIAGAAKGNFTMMDNLGVAMNATTIEAYAMSKGIDKSFDSMSKAEQTQYAMEMFLEKTTYAMGNYTKENETFAGSLQTMKASISNFMSGAGDIESVIQSVSSFANIVVKSIGEMAPKVSEGITQLINGLIPQLPILLQQLLPSIINSAISLIQGLVTALPTLIPVLMDGIVQAFSGIVQILPQLLDAVLKATMFIIQSLAEQMPTLLPLVIDSILEIIPLLTSNIPLIINTGIDLLFGLIDGIIYAIPSLIDAIPTIIEALITGFISNLPVLIGFAPTIIISLIKGIVSAIPSLVAMVPQLIIAIVNGFKNGLSNFVDVGKNLIEGLWNGIKNAKDWVIKKIKSLGTSILNGIKDIFGIHSPSKVMFEIGGYLDKGFIEGVEDMEKDINKQMDSTFGRGLDYLYNGYDNFAFGLPNTSYANTSSQTIYLKNANENSSILEVDGKVLAQVVNSYNDEREVAI